MKQRIIVFILLIIIILLFYLSNRDEYTRADSGRYYKVNTALKENMQWAANTMSNFHEFSLNIANDLSKNTPPIEITSNQESMNAWNNAVASGELPSSRLKERLRRTQFHELFDNDYEVIGVTVNKGDSLGLRLFTKYENKIEFNQLYETLLHELAHVMSSSYGHNDEFYKNQGLLTALYPPNIYNSQELLT